MKRFCVLIVAAILFQFFSSSSVAQKGFFNLMIAKRSGAPDSQSLTITNDNDDGEIWTAGPLFDYNGEFGTILYSGVYQNTPLFTFVRFALTKAIPAGATVTSATLNVRGVDFYGWHALAFYLKIQANDSADAAQVTSINDYPGGSSGFAFTSNVNWPTAGYLDSWNSSGMNASPDLKSIIQFLVNKYGGLASGAHVQLWLYSDQSGIDAEAGFADYGAPDFNTTLDINWTP